jgi:hypothetical protein
MRHAHACTAMHCTCKLTHHTHSRHAAGSAGSDEGVLAAGPGSGWPAGLRQHGCQAQLLQPPPRLAHTEVLPGQQPGCITACGRQPADPCMRQHRSGELAAGPGWPIQPHACSEWRQQAAASGASAQRRFWLQHGECCCTSLPWPAGKLRTGPRCCWRSLPACAGIWQPAVSQLPWPMQCSAVITHQQGFSTRALPSLAHGVSSDTSCTCPILRCAWASPPASSCLGRTS